MPVKKISALLLALLFLIALCSCERQNQESDFSYEAYEDGWVISSATVLSRTVRIPETHDGKPILGIKESAFYRNEILRELTGFRILFALSENMPLQTVPSSTPCCLRRKDAVASTTALLKTVPCFRPWTWIPLYLPLAMEPSGIAGDWAPFKPTQALNLSGKTLFLPANGWFWRFKRALWPMTMPKAIIWRPTSEILYILPICRVRAWHWPSGFFSSSGSWFLKKSGKTGKKALDISKDLR